KEITHAHCQGNKQQLAKYTSLHKKKLFLVFLVETLFCLKQHMLDCLDCHKSKTKKRKRIGTRVKGVEQEGKELGPTYSNCVHATPFASALLFIIEMYLFPHFLPLFLSEGDFFIYSLLYFIKEFKKGRGGRTNYHYMLLPFLSFSFILREEGKELGPTYRNCVQADVHGEKYVDLVQLHYRD
ncbi:hypothetical protein ACJX0J_019956, partial [Zea mays]